MSISPYRTAFPIHLYRKSETDESKFYFLYDRRYQQWPRLGIYHQVDGEYYAMVHMAERGGRTGLRKEIVGYALKHNWFGSLIAQAGYNLLTGQEGELLHCENPNYEGIPFRAYILKFTMGEIAREAGEPSQSREIGR